MPEEPNPLRAQTMSLLKQYQLHARKGLGQHFLIDSDALEASLSAAELSSDDTVIEIGPGLGVLTLELARLARRVIAIEIDPRIASSLTRRFSHLSNVTILNADILQVDIKRLPGCESTLAGFDYKVVANLPYYIAAPTIRRFLEAKAKPRRMVLMVQKEVAESIAAAPGKMSILGVSVQFYGKPTIVSHVPAASFYPPPKVDSAIVRIDVYDRPVADVEVNEYFRVVKAGFSAPRKQLRNALSHGLSITPAAAVTFLEDAGISSQRRAETLNVEEWAELYRSVQGGALKTRPQKAN